MKLYVLRSKKTGYLFVFQQLCDDGYGKYYADTRWPLSGEDTFAIFNEWQLDNVRLAVDSCSGHTADEVEFVELNISLGEVVCQ